VMDIEVNSPKIYTLKGVPVSVTGVAQVKVDAQNEGMLYRACQQFLDKTTAQLRSVIEQTLEGHQRSIMGTMTVEEIYQSRQKFSAAVFQVAQKDFLSLGLTIVSYTIKDVRDDQGYLKALGVTRTAQVTRDGIIGEAEAQRDSKIKSAEANQVKKTAEFEQATEVARAELEFKLKKASYDIEVETQRAKADSAAALQNAKTEQAIRKEEIGIQIMERSKEIEVQEQEIIRKRRELEANVEKPAEAEKYRLEQLAEASKAQTVMQAEGHAEAVKRKGEAVAFAINAKAQAEAAAMQKKAEAFKQYNDAALVDMVLGVLPQVVAEVASPLTSVQRMAFVSDGDSPIGAEKLASEVLSIVERLPQLVRGMTGVDLTQTMKAAMRSSGV